MEEYMSLCDVKHLESSDKSGRRPLHLACMYGHGEMVDALLNRGGMFMDMKFYSIVTLPPRIKNLRGNTICIFS